MPAYKVDCPNCHHKSSQFLTKDVGSFVMKCPGCMRGITVRKIKTAGVIEAQADGVVGYLRYDNKKNSNF